MENKQTKNKQTLMGLIRDEIYSSDPEFWIDGVDYWMKVVEILMCPFGLTSLPIQSSANIWPKTLPQSTLGYQ